MSQLRRRLLVISAGALLLAGCTGSPEPGPTSASPTGTAPSPSTSAPPTLSPSPDPTIAPEPAPVIGGTSRGRMIFVQRAEDAALVAGGRPIRLTLARTGNSASWFSAPAQRRAGTMSTEQMLLSLGWRPSEDGATSRLPRPRPQAFLASAEETLAFTIRRGTVRADGTLVLDITPVGPAPDTIESFGAVSLTIDGVPGVRVQRSEITAGLDSIVTISGKEAQQVIVQFTDADRRIVESRYLAPDRPEVALGPITVESGATITEARLRLTAPSPATPGAVELTGVIDLAGTPVPLEASLARWTFPER